MTTAVLMPPVALACIAGLLGIGLYGLLDSRNLIKHLMVLADPGQSSHSGPGPGRSTERSAGASAESLATTVIVADTVVAIVGLALVVQVHRRTGTLRRGRPVTDARANRMLAGYLVSRAWPGYSVGRRPAVWLVGDRLARWSATPLAVGASVTAALASLVLVPMATSTAVIRLPVGGVFGTVHFRARRSGDVHERHRHRHRQPRRHLFTGLHGQAKLGLARYYSLVLVLSAAWSAW